MATEVVMPKQGNTVESCIILEWKVQEGDTVKVGDVVCEAETDKSTIDVESTAEGTVLKLWYQAGDEVPVMQPILTVGEKGEKVEKPASVVEEATAPPTEQATEKKAEEVVTPVPSVVASGEHGVSPRAKGAAAAGGIDPTSLTPSGPKGRVIERDVIAAVDGRAPLSPVAKEALLAQGLEAPRQGSGIGGRVLSSDLVDSVQPLADVAFPGPVEETPVRSVRKITAQRMHASLATTAQFTMNAYADATALQSLRARFKASAPELGLQGITINDIILYAVAKTIVQFPYMNTHFLGDKMLTFTHVHLGSAVDTPKGLLVPVVKFADQRSLKGISDEFKRLATASIAGKAQPEDLSGGTFTVTNLGALGIDTFTPVLNVPEVAILGVGGISMRALEDADGDFVFIPHIGLSLTIDHQGVDGAPAAKFLKALCANIGAVDILLAL
ncbi:MAG: dihydrolipoamide acetyltransferase family protein [Sphaerochaetaceae bacterium]